VAKSRKKRKRSVSASDGKVAEPSIPILVLKSILARLATSREAILIAFAILHITFFVYVLATLALASSSDGGVIFGAPTPVEETVEAPPTEEITYVYPLRLTVFYTAFTLAWLVGIHLHRRRIGAQLTRFFYIMATPGVIITIYAIVHIVLERT
jgi:hypothetical protein